MLKMIVNRYKRIQYNKKKVKVGKNTRILTSWLNFGSEPYLIEIGENCTITSGVRFITHDASIDVMFNYVKKPRKIGDKKYEKLGKIKIGNNCVLGINSIILPGITVGPNSIIGAGSVVTKNVPEGVIVAGNPAKRIMTIDEYIEKTKKKLIKISKPNCENEILEKLNTDG